MGYVGDQDPVTADSLREAARLGREFDTIPLIDFAGMLGDEPDRKAAVAASLRDACTRVGFFYLANHGVPAPLIDSAFARARRFFALPLAAKMACDVRRSAHFCGYVPLLAENGDLHEAFDFAAEDRRLGSTVLGGDYRQAANLWPAGLPGFRDAVSEYADALRLLTRRIFATFALALDLPEDYFARMTDRPISMLRILHYPSQKDPIAEGLIGVRAHTDHECFTILLQDDITALQVRTGSGQWMNVPRIPGTFVVNIGDQMARWTNGLFASTLHRVVNVSGRERYSIPFFVGANHDAVIEALPSCVGPDNPAKYEPIIAGAYVSENIQAAFERTGPAAPL
jgi:isopenicillin N synthase-like dioxygenase